MKGNAQELLFTRKFIFPLGTDCLQKACCHPYATRWVACDECGRWFHCLCVGLKRNAETVDFVVTVELFFPGHFLIIYIHPETLLSAEYVPLGAMSCVRLSIGEPSSRDS